MLSIILFSYIFIQVEKQIPILIFGFCFSEMVKYILLIVFSKKGIRNSQSNMQTFSISPQDRTKILSLQIRRDGTCVKKYFSLLAQSYT
jgi:hypothetical protein